MKTVFFCFTLSLFTYSLSFGQVKVITGSHATVKTTYNAGAGNNRMLVVTVSNECFNNCVGSVSSITYGSTGLTFQESRHRSNDVIVEVWTLDEAGIAAESGSAAFTVNWSAGATDELFSVVTITNVDQTTPVPATQRTRGDTDNLTLGALNAGDNDMVFYATASREITSHTPSTNYTELSDQSSGLTMANAYREISTASAETPTATMGVSGSMVMIGMYFQFVSGSDATYTGASDGNWDIGTTWGGACASSCTAGIDYPDAGFDVSIPSGVDITIPASLSVTCNNLYVNSDRGTTAATLTLTNSTSSLQVNNDLFVQASGASAATGTTQVDMNGGSLDVTAGLTLEASVTSGLIAGSSSDSKTSYTPAGGTDRLLVVTVGDENNNNIGTISSITWGSTALTFQVGETRNNDLRTEIWTLDEAGITSETGAQNFTVTWSSGPAAEKFNVVTLFNVDQVTPVAATKASANANGTSVQATPSLSVSANDLYFYATAHRPNNQTHTPSAGYTEVNYQSGGWAMATAIKQITAAGTEQPTATWSSSQNMVIAGMVVNGSGAGSTQEAVLLTDGGTLTVTGDITLFSDGNNTEIDLATTAGSTLVTGGNLVEDGSSSTAQLWSVNNNSTINYNGAAQTIQTTVGNTAITTLNTLTLEGSGAKTLEGNLTVNNNLNMQGTATFANGGNTLTYGATAVLTYAGSATQTTGDELTSSIEGLVINNANNVNLNSDVTVNDDINFTSGVLILGANDVTANTISGYDENQYFVTDGTGYLQRDLGASSTVDFPVGISTTTLSNLVQLTPGDVSTFQVRVSGSFSNVPNDATQVANAEWNIDRTAGSAATSVRLSWRDDGTMSFGASFSPSDSQTEIARWTGAKWTETSTTAKDATGPDYYFEATGFTAFSPFGVGSGGMSLPVELVSFSANSMLSTVQVEWSTSSETNNDYFLLERSENGIDFYSIKKITGAGTTNTPQSYKFIDSSPLPGQSYYRLRQIDYDGQFEIFDPVTVYHDLNQSALIYPNPVQNHQAKLNLQKINSGERVSLTLYNMTGRIVYQHEISKLTEGNQPVSITFPQHLIRGLYNVKIASSSVSEMFKVMIE